MSISEAIIQFSRLQRQYPIAMPLLGLVFSLLSILLLYNSTLLYKPLFIALGVLGVAMNGIAVIINWSSRNSRH